jgi:hypothetical protein
MIFVPCKPEGQASPHLTHEDPFDELLENSRSVHKEPVADSNTPAGRVGSLWPTSHSREYRHTVEAAASSMWFLCGFESRLPLTQLNAI